MIDGLVDSIVRFVEAVRELISTIAGLLSS